MEIEARGVSVNGPHGTMLEPTTLTVSSGEVTVVSGPPGSGHTALALVLGGRMTPATGAVRLDGSRDLSDLPDRVTLVDVASVSEPDDALPLGTVVGEDLAFAHQRNTPRAVDHYLASRGVRHLRRTRIGNVPPDIRISLFAEVASRRPGVHGLILGCPDRYGASARHCLDVAASLAEGGFAVLLQLMDNSVANLDVETITMGTAA